MEIMIQRADSAEGRVFPPPEAGIYLTGAEPSDLTPDQRVGHKVLSLAKRNFTLWQRFAIRKPDPITRVAHLLFHHRKAMEAELDGQLGRADFFWGEFYTALSDLFGCQEVWEALARFATEGLRPAISNDPLELRRRLVEEVFIDSHCGFYNGHVRRVENLSLASRAFIHFNHIRNLVEVAGLSGEALLPLLGPPSEKQIALYREARRWDEAKRLGSFLAKCFPSARDFQDRLIALHLSVAVEGLGDSSSEATSLADARRLKGSAAQLETLRAEYPYNLDAYQVLGHIYHLLAIKLANGRSLSEALLAAQKSITFYPDSDDAQQTRVRLIEMMQGLQTEVGKLERELARMPNATLNAAGQQVRREAQVGFKLISDYAESTEAKRLAQSRSVAFACDLWQRIGLAQPADRRDERALSLLDALVEILNDPPPGAADLPARWAERAGGNALLGNIDPVLVCAFLRRHIFDEPNKGAEASPERTFAPPANPPLLETRVAVQQQGAEPFSYWLVSRRDMRVKLQAVVAILLLLAAGGLAVKEMLGQKARDSAFLRIIESRDKRSHLGVIEGAEEFLSSPSLVSQDAREAKVKSYYDEALVRWVLEQKGEPDAATLAHLNRYRQFATEAK